MHVHDRFLTVQIWTNLTTHTHIVIKRRQKKRQNTQYKVVPSEPFLTFRLGFVNICIMLNTHNLLALLYFVPLLPNNNLNLQELPTPFSLFLPLNQSQLLHTSTAYFIKISLINNSSIIIITITMFMLFAPSSQQHPLSNFFFFFCFRQLDQSFFPPSRNNSL